MWSFKQLGKMCFVLVLSLFFLQGLAFAEAGWVLTDKGAKVWNLNPQPNESVTWTGGVDAEGYASGTGLLQWYVNGIADQKFEGKMVNGKATGKGVYTWPNGDRFEGGWVDGMRSGKGVLTYKSGTRYEGDFANSKQNGYGVVTTPNGTVFKGQFVNGVVQGEGTMYLPDGSVSSATYVNGKPVAQTIRDGKNNVTYKEGATEISYPNGDKYVGEKMNGKAHGRGKVTWADGSVYEGDFVNNVRTGKGKYTWTNGDIYEGDFVDGARTGKGVFMYRSGSRYEGDFVDGAMQGKGKYTSAKGDSFEGDWVNNEFHGRGVAIVNGKRIEGNFVKGVHVISAAEAAKATADEYAEYAKNYPVGTRVEVVRWSRIYDSYGYAGIVRENDGTEVTLEVIAFINVNNDVEAAPASGGKRLVKGQDIGTRVTTNIRNITGYYKGDAQANEANPYSLAGDYKIIGEYEYPKDGFRNYALECTETGKGATVLYFYNNQTYSWHAYNGKHRTWPANVSFHQAAVNACRGLVD